MSKNQTLLNDFTEYCQAHPEERFWQALRNWAGVASIFAYMSRDAPRITDTYSYYFATKTEDTYYWTGKRGFDSSDGA